VNNTHSTGSVIGVDDVGGLVGHSCYDGTVSNSYSTGNVTGYSDVGGLVGNNRGSVNSSHSTGSVIGVDNVGGLVGNNMGRWDGWSTVFDSYSTGNVSGNQNVGGLVGRNDGTSRVCNSYSTGNVNGNQNVGGLVGKSVGIIAQIVRNSFWDTETSGQATSDGGTGKNTTEMQDITTFSGVGWNITGVANITMRDPSYIWNIVNNVTYPFLSWQS